VVKLYISRIAFLILLMSTTTYPSASLHFQIGFMVNEVNSIFDLNPKRKSDSEKGSITQSKKI